MSALEFIATVGKTFSVQLYNATTGAAIGAPVTGVTDSVTPTRYRVNVGSNAGVVFVVATATNVRVSGYFDLDNPVGGYSQLVDSLTAVDESAIALEVFRRLAGQRVALADAPIVGSVRDVVNSLDYSDAIDITTGAGSLLVFTVRKCVGDSAAQLEADSAVGLYTLAGASWPTAGDGSVTRTSSTRVDVRIKAAALQLLPPGKYAAELRELASGNVIGGVEFELNLRRSAGRRVAA